MHFEFTMIFDSIFTYIRPLWVNQSTVLFMFRAIHTIHIRFIFYPYQLTTNNLVSWVTDSEWMRFSKAQPGQDDDQMPKSSLLAPPMRVKQEAYSRAVKSILIAQSHTKHPIYSHHCPSKHHHSFLCRMDTIKRQYRIKEAYRKNK